VKLATVSQPFAGFTRFFAARLLDFEPPCFAFRDGPSSIGLGRFAPAPDSLRSYEIR